MSKMNRRTFIKSAVVAGVTASTLGGANLLHAKESSAKILILGGGYGGSTTAKYLKLLNPALDVTLIDRKDEHISCAMSNEVIFNLSPYSKLVAKHDILVKRYGVKFVKAEVQSLDSGSKVVKTSNGNFAYDILVVSPGIGYKFDKEIGFTKDILKTIPGAWIAGEETLLLKKQVDGMKKGDTVVIRTPKALYRCPPGPYERSCLMAERAKKVGAKVIVLDPNKGIVSKAPLFKAAFENLYKDVLTYITEVEVKSIDVAKRVISTNKGDFKGNIINYIPNQQASDMAFSLELVDKASGWAPINPATFESTLHKDVYVIGDAIYSEPVTTQPKSGVIANNMGQMLAQNIVRRLEGKDMLEPILGNSCYSMVSSKEAIWIASVYKYNPATNKIEIKDGANGIPEKSSVENFENLESWSKNFFADSFL